MTFASINAVQEAFKVLYDSAFNRDFVKSSGFIWNKEKLWLPLVRFYLLGYFSNIVPECKAQLPLSQCGFGRIDFMIGDVAVEFAVRLPNESKSKLNAESNKTEVCKLLRYDGPSALVLFDFSRKNVFSEEDFNQYRTLKTLHGNAYQYPFNILYYYRLNKETKCVRKNVRAYGS